MKKHNFNSAIEWLISEHFGGIENCTPDFRSKIEQAKEIEKQQMFEFADEYADQVMAGMLKKAKEFYNEYQKSQQ